MNTNRPVLRRVGIAAAGVLVSGGLVGALVLGGGTIANASPIVSAVASTAPSASASAKLPHGTLRALLKAMPKSLRDDVAKLRKDSPAARKTAVAAIEKKAIAGGYGTEVQAIATKLQADWSSAPTSFKHAVQGLREGTQYERAAQLRMVYRRALAGKYGTTIQQDAQQIESSLASSAASGS
jgi:hypothetical protein